MTDVPEFAWPFVRRIEKLTGATVDPLCIHEAWHEIEALPTAALQPRMRVASHNGHHATEEAQRESYRLEYKMLNHERKLRLDGKVPPHMVPGWSDGEDLRTVCQDIKQRVSVREFIERECGYSVSRTGRATCPLCDKPHLAIYDDTGRCTCFAGACAFKGDVIELAQRFWQYDKPIRAIERLRQW